MQQHYDHTFDTVIIGSGSAALATALAAADKGLSTLMIESTDKWGGSSAMSGGGLWMPNNPLMQEEGALDSREEALTYLEKTVGRNYRVTSEAHHEAFVDSIADFVTLTRRYGVHWTRAAEYPDYYPELPGGKIGRGIEVEPLDSKILGPWYDSLRLTAPLPMKTDDVWLLARAWSTPAGFLRGAQFVFRTLGGLLTGQRKVGIGAGLATALFDAAVTQAGAELWLNTPAQELLVEDGRVVGVQANRNGQQVTIKANRGVMLAGGGFESNAQLRLKHHGIAGSPSGNPGNIGVPIQLGRDAGAATELLDDAWWGASIAAPTGGDPSFIVGERALPYSIMVDQHGRRFANEAESYVDLGHHMLEHDKDGEYWLILDSRHTARYLRTFAIDPKVNKQWQQEGVLHKAENLWQLAQKLGFDVDVFRETIERFNGFAATGIDQDFGRGNSAYDRYYGDPTVIPNSNLGRISKGPFTAYKVVIGDLGTKGGIVIDPNARALREDGSVIEGLYAAGNNSASIMGRTYPGPGSTIGPACVLGMRGANHMAGSES